jgi:uncharacterized protein
LSDALTVKVATSMTAIPAAAWDRCARGLPLPGHEVQTLATGHEPESTPEEDKDNPFTSHAFLMALESSGCTGGRTGWSPAHVIVEDAAGQLLAAAPSYLKGHSQGEYVFDHAWADAYERAGGHYYPKVQVSVPFTPATGKRLLVAAGPQSDEARRLLIAGLEALCSDAKASSVHATFATDSDIKALTAAGYLERHDLQFHWQNEGFATYDDFLGTLASRKRKALKRERREALEHGLSVEVLTGDTLTEEVWDDFYRFYEDTGARKWGRPYLTRSFFSAIGQSMPDKIVLMIAKRDGRRIAGAINFRGANALYGRNWGAIEEHPFLHFELCYHQAIDYAIAHGLARVEAGAQGEHKLARGYLPSTTYSAHDIADPRLRRAIADYLERERGHVVAMQQALLAEGPYRQTGTAAPPSE